MRRTLVGSTVGMALAIALGFALVPLRSHLSVATTALVFVLPVVAGAIVGGFPAGVASVAAGFFVYDFGFIQPYGVLRVGNSQDWVTLAVYVMVMLLVSRVVANLDASRSDALSRTADSLRLFDLSDLLVEDRSVEDLLETIVSAVSAVFEIPGVALLVPRGERLEIAAAAGEALSSDELRGLEPVSGIPISLNTWPGAPDDMRTVALSAAGRPVGMLAMRGIPNSESERALLRAFANYAALALERTQLREQALRLELLEEVDQLRHAMVGAVSHELRTPLATMKIASSILVDPHSPLSASDARELFGLIDVETDRLTRLVTSLLDMTRIDAGVLELRRSPTSVSELVSEAVVALGATLGDRSIRMDMPDDLPAVDVDRILVGQVIANLIENANRHAPPESLIEVAGEVHGDRLSVSVADRGPGVPPAEHETVFDRYARYDTGGRAGLGLTIAKTFVEAHGEDIWVEDGVGGGARFVFTLPIASSASSAVNNGVGP